MEAQEVWSRHQAELAEPQQDATLETVQSLHPPSEKPNSREGLTSWLLTAGDDRITRNRVFIYAAVVVAEAHSVFICIFIRVCYPQQRSSAECCVGREFQDHCFWYPTSYLANCQFYGECYPWRIGQLIYSLLLSMGPQVLFSRLGKSG